MKYKRMVESTTKVVLREQNEQKTKKNDILLESINVN